jgi:uncharacterized protein (TIGR03000 family)
MVRKLISSCHNPFEEYKMRGKNWLVAAAGLLGVLVFGQVSFVAAQTNRGGREDGKDGQTQAQTSTQVDRNRTDTMDRSRTDYNNSGTVRDGRTYETWNNGWNNGYYYGESYYPSGRWGWRRGYSSYTYPDYGGYYSSPSYGGYTYEYPNYNGGFYAGQFGTEPGFYGQANMNDNRVLVRVLVPNPTATVTFEGQPTMQQGFDRLYISPVLQANQKYSYTIRVTWMDNNGRETSKEKKITFHPNEVVAANFMDQRDQRGSLAEQLPAGQENVGRQELSEPNQPNQPKQNTQDNQNQPKQNTQDNQNQPKQNTQDNQNQPKQNTQDNQTNPPADRTAREVDGKIVSITNDRVALTDAETGNERTFRISTGTSLMRDGKTIERNDLKAGTQVKIHLKAGSRDEVEKIEATGNNPNK